MRSTDLKVSSALKVISFKLPIGVATTYNIPLIINSPIIFKALKKALLSRLLKTSLKEI
jgi:hypothetical protein